MSCTYRHSLMQSKKRFPIFENAICCGLPGQSCNLSGGEDCCGNSECDYKDTHLCLPPP